MTELGWLTMVVLRFLRNRCQVTRGFLELGWLTTVVLRFLRNRCQVTRGFSPRGLVTHSCPAETATDYTPATALDCPILSFTFLFFPTVFYSFLYFPILSDYTPATAPDCPILSYSFLYFPILFYNFLQFLIISNYTLATALVLVLSSIVPNQVFKSKLGWHSWLKTNQSFQEKLFKCYCCHSSKDRSQGILPNPSEGLSLMTSDGIIFLYIGK